MTQDISIPKLSDVLTEDTVLIKEQISDWREAIRKAGELLVNIDVAEPRYINAMIKFCEEHNAYIVLAPGIALPHARPEDGAKKVGFCLITLKKPIEFGHKVNDPVDLVIALCAPDNNSHIKALAQLAEILMDKTILQKIRDAQTKKELLAIIKNV